MFSLSDSSSHQPESGRRREPASETPHLCLGHGGLSRRCVLVPAFLPPSKKPNCSVLETGTGSPGTRSWSEREKRGSLLMASAWRSHHTLEMTVHCGAAPGGAQAVLFVQANQGRPCPDWKKQWVLGPSAVPRLRLSRQDGDRES